MERYGIGYGETVELLYGFVIFLTSKQQKRKVLWCAKETEFEERLYLRTKSFYIKIKMNREQMSDMTQEMYGFPDKSPANQIQNYRINVIPTYNNYPQGSVGSYPSLTPAYLHRLLLELERRDQVILEQETTIKQLNGTMEVYRQMVKYSNF
jgi:hypothetical protein